MRGLRLETGDLSGIVQRPGSIDNMHSYLNRKMRDTELENQIWLFQPPASSLQPLFQGVHYVE